jgi:hypothetical protein
MPRFQASNSTQIPNPKAPMLETPDAGRLNMGALDFGLVCDLMLGIWDLPYW